MSLFLFLLLTSLRLQGVSGVDRVSVSVMEGDPVTLNTDVQTNQQDRIRWYYNDFRIARITGDQRDICTDVQCKERFRDRLKLDHQTGSLTIKNTRNTDSGEYTLQIISDSSDSVKIFIVSVTALPDPDPDPDPGLTPFWPEIYAAVIVAVILQIVAVIYLLCKRRARRNEANRTERDNQESGAEDSPPDQRDTLF